MVMEALSRANRDHAVGYGDDVWTEEAVRKIREAFTPDCEPLFEMCIRDSYLVKAAGKDANLLMNIGPQPDGELPAVAMERRVEMGEWMKVYGETIYGTRGGCVAPHQMCIRDRTRQYRRSSQALIMCAMPR